MYFILNIVLLFLVGWDCVSGDCGVVTRNEWGGVRPVQQEYLPRPVDLVIIQHTVTPKCSSDEGCAELVRNIQKTHMESYDFWDIGQSFLVGGNGKVYEGPGWLHVGAHTRGYNRKAIAVSFIGDFSNTEPTPEALAAAKALLKCGVDNGHLTSNYHVVAHRQLSATESPGTKLYNILRSWPEWTNDLSGIKNKN